MARNDFSLFGSSLYELSKEEGCVDGIRDELSAVEKALNDNKIYFSLLDSPALSREIKPQLIDEAFAGCHCYLRNMLKLLSEYGSLYKISEAAKGFFDSFDADRNICRATAVTTVALNDRQIGMLKEKLEAITGKNIVLINEVDESIIAGVLLRYDGIQLDGSIKANLESLRRRLSSAII